MALWAAVRAALARLLGATPDASRHPPGEDPGAARAEGARDEEAEEGVAHVPIEDAIDLHGFAPRDVPSVVEEYLREAAGRGFSEVRLIHGRGKGVQRANVRRLLAGSPLVVSFGDAPASRGGWGATLVRLAAPGDASAGGTSGVEADVERGRAAKGKAGRRSRRRGGGGGRGR